MPDSSTDEPRGELITGDGWFFAVSLSIIAFGAIFLVGVLICVFIVPDEHNISDLLVAIGLAVASKVLASEFPGEISFRKPSFRVITFAVIAAFGIHSIFWSFPLTEGYLKHYYSYKLFGRIIYTIIMCAVFPVVEEVYFRGLLFPIVSLRFGVKNGALLSVLLFMIYHMTMHGLLSLAIIGVTSTWLVIRTKTIIPSIMFHITYNSIWLVHGVMTAQK